MRVQRLATHIKLSLFAVVVLTGCTPTSLRAQAPDLATATSHHGATPAKKSEASGLVKVVRGPDLATGHPPHVLPHWSVPGFHEFVEGWPFAKLTADNEKLVFLMRKMARFARVGHVCSIPLILEVVDLRKRFIQPP